MHSLPKTPFARSNEVAGGFYWIAFIFVGAQILKFFLLVPEAEIGGDAAHKWSLARDIANGSLDIVRAMDLVDHHYLRWASWGPAAVLIGLTSDDIAVYYLSTALPSTLAGVIFLYVFHRTFGAIPALIFAGVWYFDPLIYRATFQLLPSGAGLLPLALLVLTFLRFSQGRISPNQLALLSACTLFWLYGAKETNIFFVPGAIAAVWMLAGTRFALTFLLTGISLYIVETVVLSGMVGYFLPGGRLFALLLEGGHIGAMKENAFLVQEQAALWDAGILSRWYTAKPFHVPIFVLSIFSFFYITARHLRSSPETVKDRLSLLIALTGLSFVLLTSFFIVSLNPVTLGQPLRPRYLTILMPLSIFAILAVGRQLPHRRAVLGSGGAIILICLIFALGNLALQGRLASDLAVEIRREVLFGNPRSLTYWRGYYAEIGAQSPEPVCAAMTANTKERFRRMFVPTDDRAPGYALIPQQCESGASQN